MKLIALLLGLGLANGTPVHRCTVDDVAAVFSDAEALGMDVWQVHTGKVIDIHTSTLSLQAAPSLQTAQCVVHTESVEELIEAVNVQRSKSRRVDDFFSDYQRLATIDKKLQDIAANSTIATYVPSIGTSHLGNTMPALVIDAGTSTNKWNAYIGGGIHAREWISPATAMFIADYFTSNYGIDAELASILDKVTFHIVPVQNPDGYEFSHTNSRLWRKNRRDNGGNQYGVDLNRNFDWQWGGESNLPRSDTYQGPSAASEPETIAMQNYMGGLKNSLIAVDLHAYGNLILRSWGWTYDSHPNEDVFLNELGNTVRSAMIEGGGQSYQSITGADLYPVTGAHDDWSSGNRDEAAGKFVGHGWCIELRGNSFILDPSNIVPTGKEIVVAMKAYMNYLMGRFGDSP